VPYIHFEGSVACLYSSKVSKDCLTLLLGGNVTGDVKLKPLLMYHSEMPQVMKGYKKITSLLAGNPTERPG